MFDELYRSGRIELELVPPGQPGRKRIARRAQASAPSSRQTGYGTELARHAGSSPKGNARDQRSPLRARVSRFTAMALIKAEREPLGQSHLPQGRARNFRAGTVA